MRGRGERERESYIRRRGEGSIDQVGREAAGALQDAVISDIGRTDGYAQVRGENAPLSRILRDVVCVRER